jgi:hypothetical protein
VSQISPPIRIVLVAAVAFMAAYMLFLRPKEEAIPAPPAPAPNTQTSEPAVSQPGKIAEAAQGAVDASNAQLQAQQGVDGVDAGEAGAATATGTAATGSEAPAAAAAAPAVDVKGVPAPVAKAIEKDKVLVLLFWNGKSADDRAVRSALRGVDDWNGRVVTHVAPIKTISRYGRIARGAEVEQSPTVVVVDPELRAETLVGFADTATIEQMVVDALRNSNGLFASTYLREINEVCARYASRQFATPTDFANPADAGAYMATSNVKYGHFERELRSVDAPRRWRAFHRAAVRDVAAKGDVYAAWGAYLGRSPSRSRVFASVERFAPQVRQAGPNLGRRMNAQNVLSCGSNF